MKKYFLTIVAVTVFVALHGQKLSVANIVDGTFVSKRIQSVNWMTDGNFYTALSENKVVKYSIRTGSEVSVLVDGNDLDIQVDDYYFSADESKILLLTQRQSIYRRSFTGVYYAYDLEKSELIGLVSEDRSSYATFSPSGNHVAYVQGNNLYFTDLKGSTTAITTDGEFNRVINGSTDWVYEEELYLTRAFDWSPDGKNIAFYRFDESEVPEYNMQTWNSGALYPKDYQYKYPKAGEKNSVVEIYNYELSSGKKTKVDIGEETDIYIPRISWTKDPKVLSVLRLNRFQNELDILHVTVADGQSTKVLTDKSSTYVDVTYCDDLKYLSNGTQFLFSSERNGYKHFYLYNIDGSLVNQVTSGNWEAEAFVGLDEKKELLFYRSTENSPMERHLYQVNLNGKSKKKLTSSSGTHSIDMSPDTKYFMDFTSDTEDPLSVALFETRKNQQIKVLVENSALKVKTEDYGFSKKEFFQVSSDGIQLNGYFLKPAGFDPNKKYPTLVYQYSGPGSQNVMRGWSGAHFVWHQLLTQKGYIVAVIDPRGTGGRGEEFKKMTYQQLGKYESMDHVNAAKYLGTLPYIDADRIGIWGWSYGGYISSLSLFKGEGVFKTAIAVAPVTSWRFYDTIYTERYLRRPQDNPEGYDENSPLSHVAKLKGNFLLIHGTGDDNVHFANSVALQESLIEEDKQFSSFYYPDLAHGLRGGNARKHLYQMITDYILENL